MQRTSSINFVCPSCGGQTYGSSVPDGADPRGPRTYHCHGHIREHKAGIASGFLGNQSCTFTWKEADSWKYFHRHIVESFQSLEEYKAAVYDPKQYIGISVPPGIDQLVAVLPDDSSNPGRFSVLKVKPS